ncbi:hypothetical protein JCM10212_002321 [Sporobolomyces blumeae]
MPIIPTGGGPPTGGPGKPRLSPPPPPPTDTALAPTDRTSPTGILINEYLTQKDTQLSDEAIHLLFSANRWEKAQEIRDDLEKGTTVVCDRYAFSGIAFSVIKGLPWAWCKSPDIGLPCPDLTLFLSLSLETASRRSGFGQERYETPEIQGKVRDVFASIGAECRKDVEINWRQESAGRDREARGARDDVWREVSAEGTVDEVGDEVWRNVEDLLERSSRLDGPVRKLWTSANA